MTDILIVDDDPHIRELVSVFLGEAGFNTCEAEDGQAAVDLLAERQVNLVILDIMMPKMDGWAVCQSLKDYYEDSLPVLMLTAKAETKQKLKGFDLGADDYLVKPFDPLELVARVKVLLKRYHLLKAETFSIGHLKLDPSAYRVSGSSGSLTLPPKEFGIFYKLAAFPGKTFSRDQLIEEIWGFDYEGDERTVDVHVKRLRQKLPEAPGFQITTVRGIGYRLEEHQ